MVNEAGLNVTVPLEVLDSVTVRSRIGRVRVVILVLPLHRDAARGHVRRYRHRRTRKHQLGGCFRINRLLLRRRSDRVGEVLAAVIVGVPAWVSV